MLNFQPILSAAGDQIENAMFLREFVSHSSKFNFCPLTKLIASVLQWMQVLLIKCCENLNAVSHDLCELPDALLTESIDQ